MDSSKFVDILSRWLGGLRHYPCNGNIKRSDLARNLCCTSSLLSFLSLPVISLLPLSNKRQTQPQNMFKNVLSFRLWRGLSSTRIISSHTNSDMFNLCVGKSADCRTLRFICNLQVMVIGERRSCSIYDPLRSRKSLLWNGLTVQFITKVPGWVQVGGSVQVGLVL